MDRRLILVTSVAALLAVAQPSSGLPFSSPRVSFDVVGTEDPREFQATAHADDGDGWIDSLQICFEEQAEISCHATVVPPDLVDRVSACIGGDAASTQAHHSFPGPGIYRVTAIARAGGCPVIDEQTVEARAWEDLVIPAPPADPIPCASPGAGMATDVGVEADRVRIGVLASLTGPIPEHQTVAAIAAAAERVNATGGVCDREIELVVRDDGGARANAVARFQELASSTLAVVTASDVFAAVLDAGMLEETTVPVIAFSADDDRLFSHERIWNLAPTHEAFAEAAVGHAYDAGARRFAIAFLAQGPWGIRVRDATAAAINSRPGASMVFDAPITLAESNYGGYVLAMRAACDGRCDAMVVALDQSGTIRWLDAVRAQDAMPSVETAVTDRALNEALTRGCDPCPDVLAWSGFDPPIVGAGPGPLRFATDALAAQNVSLGPRSEASYTALLVLAMAMGRAGGDLSRSGLAASLDGGSFDVGLTAEALSWASSRIANRRLAGFSIDLGWRQATDWLPAP